MIAVGISGTLSTHFSAKYVMLLPDLLTQYFLFCPLVSLGPCPKPDMFFHLWHWNYIFTTQYNLTYTHCNSCPPYTFTNQILTHSPQLAAMIICPAVNETNVYTFVTHFRYNQRFKFLAWLNLETRIHTHTHTPTPIYTHILTTTHKRNLNDFLSAFCCIFDFQFHSIFLTAGWMFL